MYTLIQTGILNRIGRGRFILGEGKKYAPDISPKMKAIHTKLTKEFPYLTMCIWSTSSLNEFMVHHPSRFLLLIEVEKEATQSVFYFLKESNYSVIIEPTIDLMDKYLPNERETLIVKPLVSEAPFLNVKNINTASLEKMLVDIYCDNIIFSSQQGAEMRTIFMEALNKYSVNQNRMLRYADRRRKKISFNHYLNSIINVRQ